MDGEISSTLWIRTWFGKKDDKASQDAADAAYKRLITAAFFDDNEDKDEDEDEKKLEFVFDQKEEFGHDSCTTSDENGDADPEIVDGLAVGKPGSVPSYLITAIMHCPGQFDGNTHPDYDKWRKFTQARIEEELPYVEKSQSLMVCVADRKACEDGLVLFLGINHRGQVLPFRLRDKASKVGLYEANWMDGQALHENASDPDKDVEYQMCKSDDGWGPY